MKKTLSRVCIGVVGIGALAIPLAGLASAGQPTDPGCFGQARAAGVQSFQGVGDPGASEWGAIAGDRAGTNGDQNQAYKDGCGGSPTP